jgi:hypothetical protein
MKIVLKWMFAGALALLLGPVAEAQNIFNKYAPAAGIQKNTGATYQDTSAVAADIYGLWSGTCSASTFLRGDGACASAGGGTVTSIIAGTGLTGGTITTSGTIALSTPVSATNGGTGEAGTLTGVLKGNGASAYTTALAADIYGLWSGACSSSTFLRGDGACASVGGGTPGGSNTQVQYNNSGVFGGNSGFTYDGSGSITLTGRVSAAGTNNQFGGTGAQSFGTVLNASTDGSHYALHESTDANGNQICFGLNVSGSTQCNILTGNFGIGYNTVLPFGIYRNGVSQLGFTTAGAATFVSSVTATSFSGSGSGLTAVPDSALTANVAKYTDSGTNFSGATPPTIGGSAICVASGTNCPSSSPASTTASVTSTGCTANSSVNGFFAKVANVGTLTISSFACTSNATTFTFTGFPATYQPAHQASCAALVEDNTVDGKIGSIVIGASGTISLTVASSSGSSWTAAGTKGFNNAITCSYPLN